MKNKDLFSYKRILDMLTGEYVDEIMPTDMQIAGNSETPSSSGNFALVTFDILPGQECIIGDVDFGAGASATAEIQATYAILPVYSTVSDALMTVMVTVAFAGVFVPCTVGL